MIQVTGTMFAVVLAFVILAAFQTYNGARAGAQAEAAAVLDMARAAALFPPAQRDRLRADFACYGREVVGEEWPAMLRGHSSPVVDDWINTYRAVFGRLDVGSPRRQFAFQELLNQEATRTTGRQQRLSEDTPDVPTPLWLALVFGGCVAVALQLHGRPTRAGRRSERARGRFCQRRRRWPADRQLPRPSLSAAFRRNPADSDAANAGHDQRSPAGPTLRL